MEKKIKEMAQIIGLYEKIYNIANDNKVIGLSLHRKQIQMTDEAFKGLFENYNTRELEKYIEISLMVDDIEIMALEDKEDDKRS